jgi:hypothetical protein
VLASHLHTAISLSTEGCKRVGSEHEPDGPSLEISVGSLAYFLVLGLRAKWSAFFLFLFFVVR